MDHLTLDPTVRDEVSRELGTDIPDPNSPDFEALLKTLEETRPELVDTLVQGLEVRGAELPEESQVHKAEQREGRRNLLRWLFYSQTYAGEPAFNKRKTLLVLVATLTALLPIAFVVDRVTAGRSAERVVQTEPSPFQVAPETGLVTSDYPAALPSAPEASVIEETDLPLPPAPVDPGVAGTPPNSAAGPTSPLTSFESDAVQPSALSIFEASSPPTTLTIGDVSTPPEQLGFTLEGQAAGVTASELPSAQSLSFAEPESQGDTFDPSNLGALREDMSLTAQTESAQPSVAMPSEDLGRASNQRSVSEDVDTSSSTSEEASSVDASSDTVDLQPGVQLPAQLVTGVAVSEGVSSSVVAETAAEGTWCEKEPCPAITWLGTAQLERPGRISVAFEQAVINGEARAVSASAFGDDALPGLTAAMSDTSPTVAQDLLRAAAGGVSDYLQALSEQQKVTVQDGNVVVEDLEIPSIDRFLFGRAADLFDIPSDQTAIVRVAQIEPGTPVTIFVGTGE